MIKEIYSKDIPLLGSTHVETKHFGRLKQFIIMVISYDKANRILFMTKQHIKHLPF